MKEFLRSPWPPALFVALLAAGLYAQTLAHPFFYDDVFYVVKNPAIREFVDLPQAFTQPFSPIAPGLYRPVLTVSYAIDFALAGLAPTVFHFVNILLHALASGAFFLLAFRVLQSFFPAFVAALLFALHPVHTEAVAWVAGRSELLAALFVFLSVLFFVSAREQAGKWQTVSLVISALLWFLALLSKEIALPLPLVLLVLSFISSKGSNFQYVNILKIRFSRVLFPFGLVFALYLLLRIAALGGLSIPLELTRTATLTFGERMALMVPVIAHYLRLMVFPIGLRLEYDWVSFPLWVTALSAVLVAATMVLGIWFWKREWRVAAMGIAWFFLFLLPVSNIIPIGELVAERFLYLPSAGFCLLVGAMVDLAWNRGHGLSTLLGIKGPRWLRQSFYPLILCVLLLFSFLTLRRNAEWRDPETLWHGTLERSPNAPHAAENLAAIFLAKGDLKGAGAILERQLQRFPEKPMVHYLTAQWYLRKEDRAGAVPYLERALDVAGPGNIEFTGFQRGAVLLELGRFEEALTYLERAYRANPYDASALNNLGVALANVGRREEAVTSFARAVQLFEEQGSLSEEEWRNYEGAKENLKALRMLE